MGEFGQHGYCPRPNCRWDHIVLEVFVINIIMHCFAPVPVVQQAGNAIGDPANADSSIQGGMVGYMVPVAFPVPMVPMDPCLTAPSIQYDGSAEQHCVKQEQSVDPCGHAEMPKSHVHRPCWADIHDDDGEVYED